MKWDGLFVYRALHGHDDLESVRKTITSIESMPKGHSWDVQVLVDAGTKGMFRIKDIKYDQNDRSVHIIIDENKNISYPDYQVGNDFLPPIIADTDYKPKEDGKQE